MLLSITYLYAFVNHSKKEWINMVIIMLSHRKSRKSKRPIIFAPIAEILHFVQK